MTAAQTPRQPATGQPSPQPTAGPKPAVPRLLGLHLASRQASLALTALVGCALFLRIALQAHWIQGTGPLAQQVPLLIEGTAAVVIAVATRNPFGEAERTAGRRLRYLRLVAALAMAGAAIGLLAVGSAAAHLPGGELDVPRNVAGLTGLGLLCAVLSGGALAWVGPLTYTAIGEFNLTTTWQSPWLWPARQPHDLGAALCAAVVFTIGTALITIRGTRDTTGG